MGAGPCGCARNVRSDSVVKPEPRSLSKALEPEPKVDEVVTEEPATSPDEDFIEDDAGEDGEGSRYTSSNSLFDALVSRDVVLLKGSWFAEFVKEEGAVLPRRQDLPPEALWEPQELFRVDHTLAKKVVAVSHCWLQSDHPDPYGEQLAALGAAVDQLLTKPDVTFQTGDSAQIMNYRTGAWWECKILGPGNEEDTWNTRIVPSGVEVLSVNSTHLRPMGIEDGVYDFALFIDWCSFFQEPRSEEESVRFERGLADVDLWYAHASTSVWLLTKLPEEEGSTPYLERGWTTYEKSIAGMVKPDFKVLDLGGLAEHEVPLEAPLAKICPTGRVPPCPPDEFEALLGTKIFTDVNDFSWVEWQYRRVFNATFAAGTSLEFNGLGWRAPEAAVLSRSLCLCERLRQLDLGLNNFDDDAARDIATALPSCSSLQTLQLYSNQIGAEGAGVIANALVQLPEIEEFQIHCNPLGAAGTTAISGALPKMQQLRKLSMGSTGMGDVGAAQLAGGVSGLTNLTELHLSLNDIQHAGAAKLASAFRHCPNLRTIDVRYNPVGSSAAALLRDSLPMSLDVNFLDAGLDDEGVKNAKPSIEGEPEDDGDSVLGV
mmetsp:Transcript_89522/g.208505  ORF Transcript_89522/g.208505 Transcript_89522/m.208505 type:complete len:601 (+) Transcript_89522:23-1825(+)